jgi:hypothetical protein
MLQLVVYIVTSGTQCYQWYIMLPVGFTQLNPGRPKKGKTFNSSECDTRNKSIIRSHNDSVIATLDSCQHSKPHQRMISEALNVKPVLSRGEPSEVLVFYWFLGRLYATYRRSLPFLLSAAFALRHLKLRTVNTQMPDRL